MPSTTSGLEIKWGCSQKNKGEVNKNGKHKQEKKKQVTRSKRQQVIRKTNTQTIYILPKSTMSSKVYEAPAPARGSCALITVYKEIKNVESEHQYKFYIF